MAWITTKDGRQVNTDWFDEDERKKYADIEKQQEIGASKTFEEATKDIDISPMGKKKVNYNKEECDKVVALAKKAGYEVYHLQEEHYTGGKRIVLGSTAEYDLKVSQNEVNITKASKVGKAASQAVEEYGNVIVLQTRKAEMTGSKGHLKTVATFTVFVKDKK